MRRFLLAPIPACALRRRENLVDHHRRIPQWFGHWLEGETAPPWVTQGVAWQRPVITQP